MSEYGDMGMASSSMEAELQLVKRRLAELVEGTWINDDEIHVGASDVYLSLLVRPGSFGLVGMTIELYEIDAGGSGTGAGSKIIEALRRIADERTMNLLIGPCDNQAFWAREKLSWLKEVSPDHGRGNMIAYTPKEKPCLAQPQTRPSICSTRSSTTEDGLTRATQPLR